MREIEFRLFSKKDGLMFNCYELIFVQGGIRASNGCTHIGWVKVNKGFEHKLEEELILMQYSGLKDKNGIKIFEGDVVKNSTGKLEKVVFVNGSFQCALIEHPNRNLYLLDTYGDWIEVVGTIYDKEE